VGVEWTVEAEFTADGTDYADFTDGERMDLIVALESAFFSPVRLSV
jgi:hypothetical protein